MYNSITYNLLIDENDTELLINLITKRDYDVLQLVYIRSEETFEIVRASQFVHIHKSNEEYDYFTYSLRANLSSGRYKLCESCSGYLETAEMSLYFDLLLLKVVQ